MNSLSYSVAGAVPVNIKLRERVVSFVREHVLNFLSDKALSLAGVRTSVEGAFPKSGPFIIAVNHNSHIDTVIILNALSKEQRNRLRIAASDSYFFHSKNWVHRLAVPLFNLVPATARTILSLGHSLKNSGDILLIYPEGTRSRTGKMRRFHTGAAAIHCKTDIPIVPVALTSTSRIMPAGRLFPSRGTVSVRIGEPVRLSMADHSVVTQFLEKRVSSLLQWSDI